MKTWKTPAGHIVPSPWHIITAATAIGLTAALTSPTLTGIVAAFTLIVFTYPTE